MWLKEIKFPARSRALLAAKTPQPIDVLAMRHGAARSRVCASETGRVDAPLLVPGAPDVGWAEVRGSWFRVGFATRSP
jgi:hypothetical protein